VVVIVVGLFVVGVDDLFGSGFIGGFVVVVWF